MMLEKPIALWTSRPWRQNYCFRYHKRLASGYSVAKWALVKRV